MYDHTPSATRRCALSVLISRMLPLVVERLLLVVAVRRQRRRRRQTLHGPRQPGR